MHKIKKIGVVCYQQVVGTHTYHNNIKHNIVYEFTMQHVQKTIFNFNNRYLS